jgi:hypothetical protein
MLILMLAMNFSPPPARQTPPIGLKPGATIEMSAKVQKRVYRIPGAPTAALTIRGKGITIDFAGATIEGVAQSVDPDEREGVGIVVEGSDITIKNAIVRGFKIGLIAQNVKGLRIVDCDFSYNWKQRLMSTLEREDGADWMSYHQNENDDWLRYGAAIYLRACSEFEVKGVRAIGGQNGLMLTHCDKGKVWNCNFSFLSGAGLAMYRSSDNRIMHNKIDWCARGYSHGVYNRGQDSSGIIVYEQSNRNLFAFNSVTHGGDGFFLWAGQSTMDTGKGGCNDNVLYGNDFSHAIANGIEATFSRNVFVNNLMLECWHGIWAGFSYNTKVIGNYFGLNGEAIAWEHGQDNKIVGNYFDRDNAGIALWQNERIDPNWGYGKNRDCASRDYEIRENEFHGTFGSVFRLRDTQRVSIDNNEINDANRVFDLSGKLPGLVFRGNHIYAPFQDLSAFPMSDSRNNWSQDAWTAPKQLVDGNGTEVGRKEMPRKAYLEMLRTTWDTYSPAWWSEKAQAEVHPWRLEPLNGGVHPFLPRSALRGRRYILIDEWGPYDFKRPILWPRGEDAGGSQVYEVLGPKGTARPIKLQGVTVEGVSEDGVGWTVGRGQLARMPVPGYVRLRTTPGRAGDVRVEFEYSGEATTDVRGIVTPAGKPVRFGFHKFHAPIEWTVKWFRYDKDRQEPRTQYEAFKALLAEGEPVLVEKTGRLEFVDGYKGLRDHYATLAEGAVELPAGDYVLNVTSDDGVRVWVDGKLAIDNWTWHGPTLNTAPLKGGSHKIRVEHFEIDGYSALKVDIQPKR